MSQYNSINTSKFSEYFVVYLKFNLTSTILSGKINNLLHNIWYFRFKNLFEILLALNDSSIFVLDFPFTPNIQNNNKHHFPIFFPFFFLPLFLNMCACACSELYACVYTCVWGCGHLCVLMWRAQVDVRCFALWLSTLFFKRESLTEARTDPLGRLSSQFFLTNLILRYHSACLVHNRLFNQSVIISW